MRILAAIVAICVLVGGCAPVLVGGLIWKSTKSKEEKAEFLRDLRAINLEREKAGLKPLDRCVEMFHFDPGWAAQTPGCERCVDSLRVLGYGPPPEKKSAFPSKWDTGR